MSKNSTEELLQVIIEGVQERKGNNIISIDLKKIETAEVKYFVVCEGDSTTHVSAIADSVLDYVRKNNGSKLCGKDGYENAEWIILDYVDIFVHVFQPHVRQHYNIEQLWADCPSKEYNL